MVREVDFSFDFFFGIVSLEDDDGVYEFILIWGCLKDILESGI